MKALIIEPDGILLDSTPLKNTTYSRLIRSLGKQPPEGVDEEMLELSLYDVPSYLKEMQGIEMSDEQVYGALADLISEDYRERVGLCAGVLPFLMKAHHLGLKIIAASSQEYDLLSAAFERLGIRESFADILTTTRVGAFKTQPIIYERARLALGLGKDDVLVMENSLTAISCAADNGYTVAYMRSPGQHQAFKMSQKAHYTFNSLESLMTWMEEYV